MMLPKPTFIACCFATVAALVSQGCATPPQSALAWSDLTDNLRGNPELRTDYAACLAQRPQPVAQFEQPLGAPQPALCYACVVMDAAPTSPADGVIIPIIDDVFVECMRLRGWQAEPSSLRSAR
jgi:hypothetical protein